MSRSKFAWACVFCFMLVLLLWTAAFAQSHPAQATPNKGQVENTADSIQQFVLKWFPLVFVIAAAAVCVLLYWISAGINILCGNVSGLASRFPYETGTSSQIANSIHKVETALAAIGQRMGDFSEIATSIQKVETALASLESMLGMQDTSGAITELKAEIENLTRVVRERSAPNN